MARTDPNKRFNSNRKSKTRYKIEIATLKEIIATITAALGLATAGLMLYHHAAQQPTAPMETITEPQPNSAAPTLQERSEDNHASENRNKKRRPRRRAPELDARKRAPRGGF